MVLRPELVSPVRDSVSDSQGKLFTCQTVIQRGRDSNPRPAS